MVNDGISKIGKKYSLWVSELKCLHRKNSKKATNKLITFFVIKI